MTAIVTVTLNPALDVFATTDRVVPTHKLRCDNVRRDPGGGGINVARVVTRLGGDALAVYTVGGALGTMLARLVGAEGVSSACVPIGQDTRESFTVSDESDTREYRFVLPGPSLDGDELAACMAAVETALGSARYLVLSGSLPRGAPDDIMAGIAARARAAGVRVALDTSGPALAAALKTGVHNVKPNLRELRELTGLPLETDGDRLEAARALITGGAAEVVALTLGDQGALAVSRDDALRGWGPRVEIASAVGAGDSFFGAMVWALSLGRDLEDAFRHAIAAGTSALLTAGTGLCRAEDVHRLAPQVRVQRI